MWCWLLRRFVLDCVETVAWQCLESFTNFLLRVEYFAMASYFLVKQVDFGWVLRRLQQVYRRYLDETLWLLLCFLCSCSTRILYIAACEVLSLGLWRSGTNTASVLYILPALNSMISTIYWSGQSISKWAYHSIINHACHLLWIEFVWTSELKCLFWRFCL